ncbi:MAG: hypothetical protein ABSA91_06055 [Acidimicrobiales bacterium]
MATAVTGRRRGQCPAPEQTVVGDLSTCSGIVTATGTTPIVDGSGTGAYKGISGNFNMTVTVHEVDSWPKGNALLSQTIVTSGSGTVTFG